MNGRAGTWCLFAKPPTAGRSKTRLARAVGRPRAARLASAFLVDTVASLPRKAGLLLATTDVRGDFPAELSHLERWPQGNGNLGDRLQQVMSRALATHDWVIAVGADSPGVPLERYRQAQRALQRGAPAVIGPSLDGGFFLLGLSLCPPDTFAGIPWSDATTCAAMCAHLTELGLAPVVLDPWFDVDEVADLQRLQRLLHAGSIVAPKTAVACEMPPPRSDGISVVVPTFREAARSRGPDRAHAPAPRHRRDHRRRRPKPRRYRPARARAAIARTSEGAPVASSPSVPGVADNSSTQAPRSPSIRHPALSPCGRSTTSTTRQSGSDDALSDERHGGLARSETHTEVVDPTLRREAPTVSATSSS